MKISLILATLNRDSELDNFLKSLTIQTHKDFELIVIDQNKDNKIDSIISKYYDQFPINHIKVDFTGVARARTHGIQFATSNIIAFPDDDCEYETDVLEGINNEFNKDPKLGILAVGCYEFNTDKFSIGNNSKHETYFNKFNILGFEPTQIFNTNNISKDNFYFDERFGIGAKYKSTESIELVYRLLKTPTKAFFTPKIKVYHANKEAKDYTAKRVYDYSIGIGAFIRKNANQKDFGIIYYIIRKMFIAPILKLIYNLIRFNKFNLKYSYNNLLGIWNGFLIYED